MPSVVTDGRIQSQCLNIVTDNKTGTLYLHGIKLMQRYVLAFKMIAKSAT